MTPDDMINDVLGLDQETLNDQEFYIGEIFDGIYPPEAAIWCNTHNAYIEKIDDNRYEIKAVPEQTEEEIKQARIAELKAQLSSTDYKIIKCSECSLAGIELPYDIAALHTARQALRDEINELEEE